MVYLLNGLPLRYFILENVLKITCSSVDNSQRWNLFHGDLGVVLYIVTALSVELLSG